MDQSRLVAASCGEDDPCPKVLVTDDFAYAQGPREDNPTIRARMNPGPGEDITKLPRSLYVEGALRDLGLLAPIGESNPFDAFTHTSFRLETRQVYTVDAETERLAAFLEGRPLPGRDVRTSAWARRIAVTSMLGKDWSRVRIIEFPLTDYTRFELASYADFAILGQQVHLADRDADPVLAELREDFWLLDGDTDHAMVLLMHYDDEGHFLGREASTDPDVIQRCRQQRDTAFAHSVTLNQFRAEKAGLSRV